MIYTLYLLKLPACLLILADRTNIIIGFLSLLRTEFHYAISLYKYTADLSNKTRNVKTSLLFNYFSYLNSIILFVSAVTRYPSAARSPNIHIIVFPEHSNKALALSIREYFLSLK